MGCRPGRKASAVGRRSARVATIETTDGQTILRIGPLTEVQRPTTTRLQRLRVKRLARGLCQQCGLRPLAYTYRCTLCQGIERARWNKARLRYRPTKGKRPTTAAQDYAKNLERMERMGWDVIERIARKHARKGKP